MTGKKAALVAGLAAIAVLSYVLLRGGREEDQRAGGGGSSGSEPGRGRGTGMGTDTESRVHEVRPPIRMPGGIEPDQEPIPGSAAPPPVIVDAAPHPSLADDFAAEPIDQAFASAHKREIDQRLASMQVDGVTLDGVECRAHQCRISITGADESAIGRYIAKLEDDGGLYGYAQMIVLEGLTDLPDGRRHMRVYARFE